MSSWLNAFSDDDTQVYVDANLENTDEYGMRLNEKRGSGARTDSVKSNSAQR